MLGADLNVPSVRRILDLATVFKPRFEPKIISRLLVVVEIEQGSIRKLEIRNFQLINVIFNLSFMLLSCMLNFPFHKLSWWKIFLDIMWNFYKNIILNPGGWMLCCGSWKKNKCYICENAIIIKRMSGVILFLYIKNILDYSWDKIKEFWLMQNLWKVISI